MQIIEAPRHRLRNVIIWIFVLLTLAVGAGVVYTYFFGPDNNTKVVVAPPPPSPAARKAPAVDPKDPVGVALQAVTSPAEIGANAMLTVRTKPDATCTVKVTYGAAASKDTGLAPRKADEYGTVTWTWTVDKAAPVGEAPIDVSCARDNKSGVLAVKQVLVAPKPQPEQ